MVAGRLRVLLLSLLLLVGAVAWAAPPARAAEEPAAGAEEKPNIFGAPEKGIPLGVWTVVVFLVLLWVLKRFAWGPMLEGLQKREHGIQAAIDEAHRAREEAQRLQAQWQQEMERAQDKVREIHEEARKRANENATEIESRARAEAQAERERVHREIGLARDQAVQELWKQAADLATLVSSKAIRRQLTPEDHRRLVDEALSELGEAGAERQRTAAGNGS